MIDYTGNSRPVLDSEGNKIGWHLPSRIKPFSKDWWNILANKALIQSRYNMKYTKVASFCWQRSSNNT